MARRFALFDLNALTPGRRRGDYDWSARARGVKAGATRVHFGDVASELERFIKGSDAVVGAVAWVSSRRLVAALSRRPVSLVLNKEWALREGGGTESAAGKRATLATLRGGLNAQDFPAPLPDVVNAGPIDPVRVVGHLTRGRAENTPLMHHKFIVRLRGGKPVAVWSGSLNFTHGGESNIENALEIHDPAIAEAYLLEWARLLAVSEPMEFAAGKADPAWDVTRRPVAKKLAPARAPLKAPAKRKPAASAAAGAAKRKPVAKKAVTGAAAARKTAGAKKPTRPAAAKARKRLA